MSGRPESLVAVPLLVPDLPGPDVLMPYLHRMHAARLYSNFGPLVRELEAALLRTFSRHSSVPLALSTVSSATSGLELALAALELPAHSRILLPSLTFVATATAVLRAGHTPVLADVDAASWLLTPAIAREAMRHVQIDAVMPVAAFGLPQAIQDWSDFEQKTGIPVIVDAAAGFGSQWVVGSHATVVFSLHATKSLPAGEGGVIVSTNPVLVEKVRQLSNFGINLDGSAQLPVGVLARVGTNAKMSEYHAAVGLAALAVWESGATVRRKVHARLRAHLDAVAGPGVLRWQALVGEVAAPTLLCPRLPDARIRERLESICLQRGIGTRRWYQPLLARMLAVAPHCVCLPTPNATTIASDLCGLPFFTSISRQQEDAVAAALRDALADTQD